MDLKNFKTTIYGDRIDLKILEEEDASEEYCGWLNDAEVTKYLETKKATLSEIQKYIHDKLESEKSLFFGIFWKENNQLIGTIKLEPIDFEQGFATMGIMIGNKNYWGRGIATEALRMITEYVFKELGLPEVNLGVVSENKAAIRAYEKCGYAICKIESQSINYNGTIYDHVFMKKINQLRKCARCVMPETHETIIFDAEGICNICRQIEYKKEEIDWLAKKKELDQIIETHRGKRTYDCIVPFSGGKDSTWTLYYLVKEYKVKPLVVQFDHGFLRPNLRQNNERIFKKLGVDSLSFRPNWQIVKKLMLEALKRKGDFCWHCHTGIFAYPMQLAVKFKIPLVIWGEPSAEYTSYYSYDQSEEVDERRFNRFINLGITAEDMVGMLDGSVSLRDLEPFRYPPLKDLRAISYRSICLGSFIPWDVRNQVAIIKKELGWHGDKVEGVPSEYDYDKIECAMQGVRDYLKFIKRGFARTTHLTSIDIRNDRLTRAEALELVKKYEGKRPVSLDVFLNYLGITEKEFNEIAASHAVSPHQPTFDNLPRGEELPDQKLWNKD